MKSIFDNIIGIVKLLKELKNIFIPIFGKLKSIYQKHRIKIFCKTFNGDENTIVQRFVDEKKGVLKLSNDDYAVISLLNKGIIYQVSFTGNTYIINDIARNYYTSLK